MSPITNSATSTAGAMLDPDIISSHHTENQGYVGAVIPFVVLMFIIGALWHRMGWREQTIGWLDAKFGQRLREKARAREDMIERKEREQKRLDELFRLSSRPHGAGMA
ncbi:uncharacterized protein EI97DRAFT_443034 [Westerdykella ornata]|uniref:Uncharacterized protein n=1 Tax=Westerdykella ornata TaxID=318751 RepID=A0A6A6JL16_WESOR|nr:uncharacterized protein EI97DRAFT_443034 [Westerdykella ornata]KAF2275589.1 hypothetical protein EI97DRAFT_443034 [Westerdykella ornata]